MLTKICEAIVKGENPSELGISALFNVLCDSMLLGSPAVFGDHI